MPYVKNTNLEKIAIDTSAYPNAARQLLGYVKGHRIPVTYYRQMRQGNLSIRSQIADYATQRSSLTTEYQKILNLEITLQQGLEFVTDPDHASAGLSGSGMMYPYMNPSVGDVFTYGLGDGRVGVFQISQVDPTSIRNQRIFRVNFVLQNFLTEEEQTALDASVTQTSVFDKTNYLGGTATLLSETTYLNLQKLKAYRSNLSKFYHQKFYDPDIASYAYPGMAYDPYVVKFMANKITMDDVHTRAKVLTGVDLKRYKKTIWARFEDRYNTTVAYLSPQYALIPYRATRMGVFNTELHGYSIIEPIGYIAGTEYIIDSDNCSLTDDDAIPITDIDTGSPYTKYVFGSAFYLGTTTAMTPLEQRVYQSIIARNPGDMETFISVFLDSVYSVTPEEQFYRIPVYMHLIDQSLQIGYREIDAPSANYGSTGG